MDRQQTTTLLKNYIDFLLDNSDAQNPMWNIEKINSGKVNKWNYIDGCMITAILALYNQTSNKKYLDFADTFMDYFVKEDGSIRTYEVEEYNIDHINPAKNLIRLYELTGKEKYRKAMETVRRQLDTMPRTKEGNFWHKQIYPYQVWLDGLYMGQPFYMEYETKYNGKKGCLDSYRQFVNVRKRMRDEKTGLYYHGYDESRKMYWADHETGCSKNFWLRAQGWFVVALVDTLEAIDEQLYYEYRMLRAQFQEAIDAILTYQDTSGMLYQVINEQEAEGNYLETSGTALIAYAILKGVRLGFLPKRYEIHGEKAFFGTTQTYLKVSEEGRPVLGGICLVAGLGGKEHRDGSLAYYFSEPVVENEAKGVAPLLLAFTEIMRRNNG
ncbi:glycoside hydrolase family 88 protein [Niameybacter massiliensis]|uniref:Glycoside hydrolase family 88 protein n=1 Tax=Holtiella tumoricola TaxID=3018743 RepID=A0AA42DP46_9FIRM|nr:glycoside hydrolase family 88 protein [Holtiella tumoricola]MDA3732719.1 glycoside hydrolase family 88 protein [Holtiella tumoricola]